MKKIEKYSKGYASLKALAYIPFRLTHKQYIVNGLENIPKNKPIIFAPNHQNALLDPLAIIFSSSIQPVFLARADIFKNKYIAKILNFLKILPIYRIRDGKETLTKNEEVFDDAVRILKNNKMLCLFPEAAHIGIKSMLPHKKAIPRIVFITAEKTNYQLDLQLVPVGINYNHYFGFRRKVTLNFGPPLQAKEYYPILQKEGDTKASILLRDNLFKAIRKLVVHVNNKSDYVVYEQAFGMEEVANISPQNQKSRDFVPTEQWISRKLEAHFLAQPGSTATWVDKAARYKELKTKLKFTERTLSNTKPRFSQISYTLLLLTIGIPFSLWGTLSNGWLFYLTRYPYRNSIKDPQFYSSVSYVLSLLLFPFWFIALFFILESFIQIPLVSLVLIGLSIPGGIMAWESGQLISRIVARIKFKKLSKKETPELKQLVAFREELLKFYKTSLAE